jgi:hypothetical protein
MKMHWSDGRMRRMVAEVGRVDYADESRLLKTILD